MDLNLHPRKDNPRLREAALLLEGSTIVACMGDRLTLAAFGLAVPIWSHLKAAVTTADEALACVQTHRPDLCIVTEDLSRVMASLSFVEKIHPHANVDFSPA